MTPDVPENKEQEKVPEQSNIDRALTSYYSNFSDPTIPGVLKMYKENTIEHITIPPELQNNGNLWNIVLEKYNSGKAVVSAHAERVHPADCKLSLKILQEELAKGNVSTNVREPNKYREGKEQEISRLTLQTTEPVEREVTRHLHLEMALETQEQVDSMKITNEQLKKNLERLASTDPGFTIVLGCELMSLGPISKKLHITADDLLEIIPSLTPNRYTDRELVMDAYLAITGGNIFNRESLQNCIDIISEKYPKEKHDLEKTSDFKEIVSPRAVFESSFNFLLNVVFEQRGIKLTPYVMSKIGNLSESVTSHIMTAYVRHTPKLSLGPTNIMLSQKTINRF